MSFLGFQSHPHVNAPDHENVLVQLDLPHGLPDQASGGSVDVTRLQRASKGSRKSTRGGGNNVIKCRGARFRDCRRNMVMFGNRAMDSENDRLRLGAGRYALRTGPFHTLDSDHGTIDYVGHKSS